MTKENSNNTSVPNHNDSDRLRLILSSQKLHPEERLKSQKIIDALFREGSGETAFPLKVIAKKLPLPSHYPAQIAFSVPKRNFSKAVSRNRIRRKIFEAFRLNKTILYKPLLENREQIALMFIYIGKKDLPYSVINEKIIILLSRLSEMK